MKRAYSVYPKNNIITSNSLFQFPLKNNATQTEIIYNRKDYINYYPNIDGTTRIKVSEKVGNIQSWVRVVMGSANVTTGNYKRTELLPFWNNYIFNLRIRDMLKSTRFETLLLVNP